MSYKVRIDGDKSQVDGFLKMVGELTKLKRRLSELKYMHEKPTPGSEYLIWYFDVEENYAFCHSYTAPDTDKNQPHPDIKVLGWQYIETPLEAIRERLKELHQVELENEYWDLEARRHPL